jgi:hypothetical protein
MRLGDVQAAASRARILITAPTEVLITFDAKFAERKNEENAVRFQSPKS